MKRRLEMRLAYEVWESSMFMYSVRFSTSAGLNKIFRIDAALGEMIGIWRMIQRRRCLPLVASVFSNRGEVS